MDARTVSWAHNFYLETLAEQGVIGMTALGFLLARGIRIGQNLQRAPPGEKRLYGAGALAGLWGICLAGAIELSFVRQWVVITLFVCLGVLANLSADDKQSEIEEKERSVCDRLIES
jgi:O-antigen ligase